MDLILLGGGQYAAQSVAYTDTAATTTNSYSSNVKGVLVWSTTDCYIAVGNSPTATSADTPIPAGVPFTVSSPQNEREWKVSAIRISASGTLYVKPVGGS